MISFHQNLLKNLEEGNGSPSQYSFLENFMWMEEPGRDAVWGAKSDTAVQLTPVKELEDWQFLPKNLNCLEELMCQQYQLLTIEGLISLGSPVL